MTVPCSANVKNSYLIFVHISITKRTLVLSICVKKKKTLRIFQQMEPTQIFNKKNETGWVCVFDNIKKKKIKWKLMTVIFHF